MNIPFIDFSREYSELSSEIDEAIIRTVRSGWYILGRDLEQFEKNFSDFIGIKYAVGCASGTEAITLALLSLEIKAGDEVITQTNTCVPTVCGIVNSGAVPVFCDVFEESLMMDTKNLESKISNRTKAFLPVNLYGASVDYDELDWLSKKYSIPIIEDCAQSHGSLYKGKRTGTFGIMGCFSFYPTKNLGCYGDGGAIVTDDHDLFSKLLLLRNYGQDKRYYHVMQGLNSRLDEIQATVMNVKLKYLDERNKRRKKIADIYNKGFLNNSNVISLNFGNKIESVYHLYIIKVNGREKLQEYLNQNGISTLIHYPIPCHLQKAYEYLNYQKGDFPVAEKNSDKILSLPVYPQLKDEEVFFIVKTINKFYGL